MEIKNKIYNVFGDEHCRLEPLSKDSSDYGGMAVCLFEMGATINRKMTKYPDNIVRGDIVGVSPLRSITYGSSHVYIAPIDDIIVRVFDKKTGNIKHIRTSIGYRVYADPSIEVTLINTSINKVSLCIVLETNKRDVIYKDSPHIDHVGSCSGEGVYFDVYNRDTTIFLLGADGRLGSILTSVFINNNKRIIPITDYLLNGVNIKDVFKGIVKPNDIIINCMGYTNVNKSNLNEDEKYKCWWANYYLPQSIFSFCSSNDIRYVNFSSNYVFDMKSDCEYTKSKKAMEGGLLRTGYSNYVNFRLANLFSVNQNDTTNLLNKILDIISIKKKIRYNENCVVYPTAVEDIVEFLYEKIISDETGITYNVFGKGVKFSELIGKYYNHEGEINNEQICPPLFPESKTGNNVVIEGDELIKEYLNLFKKDYK